jgi:hypothetical protein
MHLTTDINVKDWNMRRFTFAVPAFLQFSVLKLKHKAALPYFGSHFAAE